MGQCCIRDIGPVRNTLYNIHLWQIQFPLGEIFLTPTIINNKGPPTMVPDIFQQIQTCLIMSDFDNKKIKNIIIIEIIDI